MNMGYDIRVALIMQLALSLWFILFVLAMVVDMYTGILSGVGFKTDVARFGICLGSAGICSFVFGAFAKIKIR